jgi:hypothetical protein
MVANGHVPKTKETLYKSMHEDPILLCTHIGNNQVSNATRKSSFMYS